MTSSGTTFTSSRTYRRRPGFSAAVLFVLRRYLGASQTGRLTVTLPSGAALRHIGARPGPDAILTLRRWRALWRMMTGGSVGLARAYIDGDCHSPDIGAVLAFGVRNEAALSRAAPGAGRSRILGRIRHWLRANTRRGSRRNIAAHYDLGNAFYARWLDGGMNYSSALFADGRQTLEQGQDAKLSRIVALLGTRAGASRARDRMRLGSARRAAGRKGGLSHHWHHPLPRAAGVRAVAASRPCRAGTMDLRLQDYRDIKGRFDRVVSIEMVEAVGEAYWPRYFQTLRQSLTDTGVAVLQAITIADSRFARYRRRPDFIQQYIFPGGMLPTLDIIRREAGRAGLRLLAQESFGPSYARTLAEWRRRFLAAWPEIEALGFDGRFRRMWNIICPIAKPDFWPARSTSACLSLNPSSPVNIVPDRSIGAQAPNKMVC